MKVNRMMDGNKKAPVKVEGNLMFTQRNNPYCDLLSEAKVNKKYQIKKDANTKSKSQPSK